MCSILYSWGHDAFQARDVVPADSVKIYLKQLPGKRRQGVFTIEPLEAGHFVGSFCGRFRRASDCPEVHVRLFRIAPIPSCIYLFAQGGVSLLESSHMSACTFTFQVYPPKETAVRVAAPDGRSLCRRTAHVYRPSVPTLFPDPPPCRVCL